LYSSKNSSVISLLIAEEYRFHSLVRESGGDISSLASLVLGHGISETVQTAAARARINEEEPDFPSVQSVQMLPFSGMRIRVLCAAGHTAYC